MWHTRFTEEVVNHKIVIGLNKEIELAWTQTLQKPMSLHDQMALLRDISHSLKNSKPSTRLIPILNLSNEASLRIKVVIIPTKEKITEREEGWKLVLTKRISLLS